MKNIVIALICLAVGFLAALVFLPGELSIGQESAPGEQQYTCGMHPEIVANEPGICPICNMKLTPKKDGGTSPGAIRIDPTTRHNMGLVTAPVAYTTITKTVRAFGKVDYSEPGRYSVGVKVSGWVERLYVAEQGERVSRGQPLLEIYSPDLVAAQKEYLVALKSSRGSGSALDGLLTAATSRLRNWDVSDDQIQRLTAGGDVVRTLIIRSPADGFVIRKSVSEGDRITPQQELYAIADLSRVWVTAAVYEQDLPFVSEGRKARVELPDHPGREYTSRVAYVSPYVDAHRQAEVRLELANPDLALRPGMYAQVMIESRLSGERLTVPRRAVINSGVRRVVYVADGDGAFAPRQVVTGAVDDGDLVEILDGLAEGELVVTSGQFLLDSESRLGEALAVGGHHHGGMGEISHRLH